MNTDNFDVWFENYRFMNCARFYKGEEAFDYIKEYLKDAFEAGQQYQLINPIIKGIKEEESNMNVNVIGGQEELNNRIDDMSKRIKELEHARQLKEERDAFNKAHPSATIHPAHYNHGKYEAWDVLDDWFPDDPLLWQAGKYLARAGHKDKMIEDLQKAVIYINRRIQYLEDKGKIE